MIDKTPFMGIIDSSQLAFAKEICGNNILEFCMVDLLSLCKELGFSQVALTNTASVPLCGDFRKYCEQNLCGEYNQNHTCPPCCGTFESMKKRLLGYDNALFVQSTWTLPDLSDSAALLAARKRHNEWMLVLKGVLQAEGIPCLVAGASSCVLCERCAKRDDLPCRNPDLSYSCLSAYCVDVFALASRLKWDTRYDGQHLTFYGILAY